MLPASSLEGSVATPLPATGPERSPPNLLPAAGTRFIAVARHPPAGLKIFLRRESRAPYGPIVPVRGGSRARSAPQNV
jgi:hypothetical protein